MSQSSTSRRILLKGGGAALAGISIVRLAGPTGAFARQTGGEVIPWLDQPAENPIPEAVPQQLKWEDLDTWITPNDQFFAVKHFNLPELTEADWSLAIDGLVSKPATLTLADLKAKERAEVTFTIECSGNTGLPFFDGGIGNATWAGTLLAPILEEAGVKDEGIEVVFWGTDAGEHTYGEVKITEHFARSMSIADAMSPDNLLAYEMNGEELPPLHGYPLRLIAPGWYGIANVKWLKRIEILDRRFQGWFMAHDYVTHREVKQGEETVWTFTLVGHNRLKSAPAKVTKAGDAYTIMGAAWGEQIKSVDVSIDDGPWQPATLTDGGGSGEEFAWTFWEFDWGTPDPGEHTITSRATGQSGDVQPAPDDPFLAGKSTYWESNGLITRQIAIA